MCTDDILLYKQKQAHARAFFDAHGLAVKAIGIEVKKIEYNIYVYLLYTYISVCVVRIWLMCTC